MTSIIHHTCALFHCLPGFEFCLGKVRELRRRGPAVEGRFFFCGGGLLALAGFALVLLHGSYLGLLTLFVKP